jgi:hypothetical protein
LPFGNNANRSFIERKCLNGARLGSQLKHQKPDASTQAGKTAHSRWGLRDTIAEFDGGWSGSGQRKGQSLLLPFFRANRSGQGPPLTGRFSSHLPQLELETSALVS